ncbi:Head-to-tail connector protein, podovirus-type [uncultured Caudovirales phage]|uniref:Head-to-tail connector protein, podovirus-type n=1 Tax=uncultured Caudovirales phage TaxID=2100421 RepID=A0A6J5NUW5_9CAUD|nr:Head-to-tail connector protein, podovirus-type [uncultured Caudovirales phage]
MPNQPDITGLTAKQKYMKRWSMLRAERATWITDYYDLIDYVAPMHGRFFYTDANKGNKVQRQKKIYDSTGRRALNVLAAGLMAGMTSPARPWFRLAISDRDLMERHNVKDWLQDVTDIMREVFSQSNTYRVLHQMYVELGAFGTACSVIMPDYENVIHLFPLTVGEYCLATNSKGTIDTVYREMQLTVGQIIDQFGYDKASLSVQQLYDRSNYDQWVVCQHVVEPRKNRDVTKLDSRNMRWKSCYYEVGGNPDPDKMLGESGFNRFPALAARWNVTGNDVYGTGPGHDALPDIRQLQHEQLRKGQAIDYQTNPPLAVPASLKEAGVNRLPGGVQYVDSVGPENSIRSMFDVRLDLQHLRESILDTRERIKQHFYEDLFLMLANDTRSGITATEVAERHEEKLLMLGPVLERLHNELLDPLIDSTFERLALAGVLPPPPREMQDMEINVQYVSMLAQAQRAVGLASYDRAIATVGALAGAKQDPTVWDKLDTDKIIDEYTDALGVPASVVRNPDEVAAMRAQRAQQQAAMQGIAAAQQVAETAATASQIDPARMQDVMGMFSGYGSPTATEVGTL